MRFGLSMSSTNSFNSLGASQGSLANRASSQRPARRSRSSQLLGLWLPALSRRMVSLVMTWMEKFGRSRRRKRSVRWIWIQALKEAETCPDETTHGLQLMFGY
jgi:hypothetical protein